MISISATPPSRIADVLSLLLSHLSEQEKLLQISDLLESAKKKELDLSGLIMATRQSRICGAGLSIIQPDQSAFVWPPVTVDEPDSEEIENQLFQFLGEHLDSNHVWMGQCITEVNAKKERQALQRNQFGHVADLIYMFRDLSEPTPNTGKEIDLKFIPYTEDNSHKKFTDVLGRTYTDSLDCSFLNNLRSLDETLGSHQLSGNFLPSQWKVFQVEGNDIGLLLMNDHPDQNAWEVVYTGVISEARGKGYGRAIIQSGLIEAQKANRSHVFLAVDSKNPYAYSVYDSLGFQETTRKSVHIRLNQA